MKKISSFIPADAPLTKKVKPNTEVKTAATEVTCGELGRLAKLLKSRAKTRFLSGKKAWLQSLFEIKYLIGLVFVGLI